MDYHDVRYYPALLERVPDSRLVLLYGYLEMLQDSYPDKRVPQTELATAMCVDIRTIKRYLNTLEQAGLIGRDKAVKPHIIRVVRF